MKIAYIILHFSVKQVWQNKIHNYKSTIPVLGDQAPPDMTIRSSSEYGVLQLAGLARPIVQHAMGVRAFPFCRLAELVPVPSSSRSSLTYRKKNQGYVILEYQIWYKIIKHEMFARKYKTIFIMLFLVTIKP